jgi:hypothetical protein
VARFSRAFLALAIAGSLTSFVPRVASAQHITVDGCFSPAQTLVGPNYSIGANLGRQVGSNLFHSFGQFDPATGESATFSGPAAGRGGLPQDPEATLPALYIAGRDLNPNPQPGTDTVKLSGTAINATARLTMRCG